MMAVFGSQDSHLVYGQALRSELLPTDPAQERFGTGFEVGHVHRGFCRLSLEPEN